MSKFVKVQTQLRDVSLIKRALADEQVSYQENAPYRHAWSGFRGEVPLLIQARGVQFGLRKTADGVYEVIGDDMQMRQIKRVLEPVQQRYAYHKVLAETESAGFNLVEESAGEDGVLRLTVRRWS